MKSKNQEVIKKSGKKGDNWVAALKFLPLLIFALLVIGCKLDLPKTIAAGDGVCQIRFIRKTDEGKK